MISDSDSPCILAVTIFLSLFFGVTFPSLLLFLSRKNSLQFIVHQGGSISSLLPWEREREVLMEPRSYHSPGEGWCGGWRRKMSTRERRMVPRLAATLPIWAFEWKKPSRCCGGGSSSLILARVPNRTLSVIHSWALTDWCAHSRTRALSLPPTGSFVTALPRLSALGRVALVSV